MHPLLLILILAFAVRFSLSWHTGYGFDIGVYQGWARSAVELGMAESYRTQVGGNMTPDYPPFSITMLTGFGHVYKWMFGNFDLSSLSFRMFIKLPATFADMTICALLFFVVRKWKTTRKGYIAAIAYALNPAAIFNTAVWGQTDAIYSMFLLAALVAWLYEKRDVCAVLLALSILTKLQGIVLFPLFAFLLFDPKKPKEMLRFATIGIFTFLVVCLPFAMGGVVEEVMNVYLGSVGRYGQVTIGAYNFWWSLMADSGWQIESTTKLFDILSFTKAGILIFGMLYSVIVWMFHKQLRSVTNIDAYFYCSALLCAAFFLFLTQMHERYLFPFVVLGIPLIFMGRKIAAAYWAMVIAFTFNMMGVLPVTVVDKALYRAFDAFDVFVAGTMVWMFIFLMIGAWERTRN